MSDKLYRIANITEIERAIGEGSTSRSSVAVSVWDGQEVALRAILERGKAPLLVRLLDEYLAFTTASHESGRAYLVSALEGREGVAFIALVTRTAVFDPESLSLCVHA